jgi:hypothetical protein
MISSANALPFFVGRTDLGTDHSSPRRWHGYGDFARWCHRAARPAFALDEPDHSVGCFFAYTVNQESVHGGVGSPSQSNASLGKEILKTCVAELNLQLKKALVEGIPLEEMPPNLP